AAALRRRVQLAVPERYVATSADGTEVECWAMAPADAGAGAPCPTILNIHGGPFTQYGYNFFDEFQLQVGAGFGVVYCNPRGSSGYSEAWGRAIRWPEAPDDPGSGWGGVDGDGRTYGWGDVAVFYRTNAQSRAVEEELVRRQIPYRVVGGTRFYDRREVKDVLAYLRAVANPADEVSLKRIVNVPKRGVGDTSVDRVDRWARDHGVAFGDALAHAAEAGVTGRALTGIDQVTRLLEEWRAAVAASPGGG
ncbi:hypothetical protein GHK86_13780, partial [Acidimicrobiaceae bacterium USS-CC1]|nr:hypothetical protein [Acidiferrimicrobium australe]